MKFGRNKLRKWWKIVYFLFFILLISPIFFLSFGTKGSTINVDQYISEKQHVNNDERIKNNNNLQSDGEEIPSNSTPLVNNPELDSLDMITLYEESTPVTTNHSLTSLGNIERVSISGFNNIQGKLNINELSFIDTSDNDIEYKVVKVNYDNPSSTSISLNTSDEDNYKLSDGLFESDSDHSLEITSDFSSKNNSIEIKFLNPKPIKLIKVSQKLLPSFTRFIGEIALFNVSHNVLISNDFQNIFDTNDPDGIGYNINIGDNEIKWSKFSNIFSQEAPMIFVPDFNRIGAKFDPLNWDIDWWVQDDNESFRKYIPRVHGGHQNTFFEFTNKIDNSKKNVKVENSMILNETQAVNIFKEITDTGIWEILENLFRDNLIPVGNLKNDLDLNLFKKLTNAMRGQVNMNILISGDAWEVDKNSLSNLYLLSFLPQVKGISIGSYATILQQYSYNTNLFYLSWISNLDSLNSVTIYGDDYISYSGNIVITGNPDDAKYISNMITLKIFNFYSYYSKKNKLLEVIDSSDIWNNVFQQRNYNQSQITIRANKSEFTITDPLSPYLKILSDNNQWIVSLNQNIYAETIPSPLYDLSTNEYNVITVDNILIKPFFKEGILYWNFSDYNIDPNSILYYYEAKNMYISKQYKSDNNISSDIISDIKNNPYKTAETMAKPPDLNLNVSQTNKVPPIVYYNDKKISIKVFNGRFILDDKDFYDSSLYFKDGEDYYFYSDLNAALNNNTYSKVVSKNISQFNNVFLDQSSYKDFIDSTFPDIFELPNLDAEEKIIGSSFIYIDGEIINDYYIYMGQVIWDTMDKSFSVNDIKFKALDKYYTSLEKVPSSEFAFISEIKISSDIQMGPPNIFSIPNVPEYSEILSDTYNKLIVDGTQYSAAFKDGYAFWEFDTSTIKYVQNYDGNLSYFTSWNIIPEKNVSYSIDQLKIDNIAQVIEFSNPFESKKITIHDGAEVKSYDSVLENGEWFWNVPQEIYSKIKYVSNAGQYFTDNNILPQDILKNQLSSVTIPLNKFQDANNVKELAQNTKLSTETLGQLQSLYFDDKTFDYKFKDGEAYIPQNIYNKIKYSTFVNGIEKYYSLFNLIPASEMNTASFIKQTSNSVNESDFVFDPASLFISSELKTLRLLVQNKNNLYETIELSIGDDGRLQTSNLKLLFSVKYIDKANHLYTSLSSDTLNQNISSVVFNGEKSQENEDDAYAFQQKIHNNLLKNIAIVLLSISGVALLSSISLVVFRRKVK